MLHLARFSIARPKTSLAVWAIIAAALIAIGLGVENRLSPPVVVVPGTEASRAATLAEREFGPSVLVPIMLEGPKAQLDAQGPKLVRDLSKRSDTRVMSAWSTSVGSALRPNPTAAMIVASVSRSEKKMVNDVQPQIERLVARDVGAPVHASITGQPSIDRALRSEALDTTKRSELLALPILFLLLLFLLRSVLAAAVCTAFGAATVYMSFGMLALNGAILPVDAVAVALGSLTGLALGMGYAMVMVRRFREEESADGGHVSSVHAASEAVATTGRAILFGGTALIICLVLALLLSSLKLEFSVGVGIVTCAALAVGGAVVVLPALLVLFGHHIDAFTPPGFGFASGIWNRVVGVGDQIVKRPAIALLLGVVAMGALAVPVLSMQTGPPDITQVPASDKAHKAFDRIAKVMGPGWATPYNVLIVSKKEPITSTNLLASVKRLQEQFARDPRVDSVIGPGAFQAQSTDLSKFPNSLNQSAAVAKSSKKDLLRLQQGLGQAGAGASQLRSGLAAAASGAGQLHGGSGQAQSGASQLKAGLGQAQSGGQQISGGLRSALAGAISLRNGAAQALSGSKQLKGGLGQANTPLQAGLPLAKQMAIDAGTASQAISAGKDRAASAADQAATALSALESINGIKGDPQYQAAVNALSAAKTTTGDLAAALSGAAQPASSAAGVASAFSSQVVQLAAGVKQLLGGSTDLAAGIARLEKGNADLANGLNRLNSGGGDLTAGLAALRNGAGQLESGLGQLTSGTGQLQSGLGSGVSPSGQLVGGLGTMEAAVAKARSQVPSTKDLERLQRESPGLFDSGYFVLAAIAGAPTGDQAVASFAVNLSQGGNAGQIVVIPKKAATASDTQNLGGWLRDQSKAFAKETGTQWAVGGPAGNLADFRSFGDSHIAYVIAASLLAIALLLGIALRAVLLPLVAVALDGLTVLATFGVLQILFSGDNPYLGGPGYLDPMSVIGIFAVVFGFTAIYEVLLLVRTRELFVSHGDERTSLAEALRKTAFAATGSAAVVIAVAIPFATTHLLSVRQFGIGVAVAVLIDAVIVRPLLLPAAVSALGKRCWWPTIGPTGPKPEPSGPAQAPPADGHRREPIAKQPAAI